MKLVELTLYDVPEDCVEKVKQIATVAVDRYYRSTDEIVDPATIEASNIKKDDFRVANGLPKKYESKPELDPEMES